MEIIWIHKCAKCGWHIGSLEQGMWIHSHFDKGVFGETGAFHQDSSREREQWGKTHNLPMIWGADSQSRPASCQTQEMLFITLGGLHTILFPSPSSSHPHPPELSTSSCPNTAFALLLNSWPRLFGNEWPRGYVQCGEY